MSRLLDIALIDGDGDLSIKPSDLEIYNIRSHPVLASDTATLQGMDAIVICTSDMARAQLLRQDISRLSRSRPPIILISDNDTPPEGFDGWLRRPVSPVQLATRIQSLRRLWVMEDVARRRKAAAEVFGHTIADDGIADQKASVLFVGEATSRFMAIRHALNAAETGMVAAFSSFSAFDYLHERPFDAVILNAIGKRELAFTISSAMRRNARLYHTPVLLLAPAGRFEAADEAFARGVSDILTDTASPAEISARVLRLANERRRRRQAKAVLENCRARATVDADLGLYRQKVALAHLQDLLNTASSARKATGLVLCEIERADTDVSAEKLHGAQQQFASMLRHLLRAEDCPALFGPDLYGAILPYTDRDGALCVAERIAAVAECTAFDSDDPLRPFRLNVSCIAVEASGEETAEALVERGRRMLDAARLEAV